MNPVYVEVEIQQNNMEYAIDMEESIQVIGGDFPAYTGSYEVTPTIDGLTLETEEKSLFHDIKVKKIPYSSVTNPQGGQTVNIAFS